MNRKLQSLAATLATTLRPKPRLSLVEWAESNLDYSLCPSYRAAFPGRYSLAHFPFWREPLALYEDRSVREVAVVAPSQGLGKSENLLLTPQRYAAARLSAGILYVMAQEERASEMWDSRILRGLRLSHETREALRTAKVTGTRAHLAMSEIGLTWATSASGGKSFSWDWVLGDEVSSWKSVEILEELRKRSVTRPNGKLFLVSTPDWRQRRPSSADPIWISYLSSDRREWHCKDATSGNRFVFRFGGKDTPDGVKWDPRAKREDGSYDLNVVRETAYYVTPDGHRIDEANRLDAVQSGVWIPTAHDSPRWRRGYRASQFLSPFDCGSFGNIAAAFLEAKSRGSDALRALTYEVLADVWTDDAPQKTPESALTKCERDYRLRSVPSDTLTQYKDKRAGVLVASDWNPAGVGASYVVREFYHGGDSALLEYGRAQRVDDLAAVADRWQASYVAVDAGHEPQVIHDACVRLNFTPIIGSAKLLGVPIDSKLIDPYRGTAEAGGDVRLRQIVINPDYWKSQLADMVAGESAVRWLLPRGIPLDYKREVLSEQKTAGHWDLRKGSTANHYLDAEVYCLALASYHGFRSADYWHEPDATDDPDAPAA